MFGNFRTIPRLTSDVFLEISEVNYSRRVQRIEFIEHILFKQYSFETAVSATHFDHHSTK